MQRKETVMNLFDITGKKAIVTGGAAGLGYAMAEALLESGCEVVIFDLATNTQKTADDWVKKGYKAFAVCGNIGNREELQKMFAKALEFLQGRLDVLIPAAGIQRRHPSEQFPIEDWDDVININLTSIFLLCQMAANVMIKQKSGKIINIASMNSFFGGQTIPAYAASKGGIMQLTRALANDLADKGLNINAIAPGYMETNMNTNLLNNKERLAQISARIPQGRWGTPNDIKGPAIFLASDASNYLNGAIIPVDGGYLGK